MAEDANARKARLKALRAAAQEEVAATPAEDTAVPSEEPQLKFRNYAVKEKKHIQFEPVPAAQPPKPAEPVEEEPAATEAEQVGSAEAHTLGPLKETRLPSSPH